MIIPLIKTTAKIAGNTKSFVLIVSVWWCAHGLIANTTLVNTNSCYFLGLTYQYSTRAGYYDFEELQKSQRVDRGSINLFGAVGGKRYALGKYARIQVGIGLDAGMKTDDTVTIGAYDSLQIKFFYLHVSLHPELQIPLPSLADKRLRPYLAVGCGLNGLYLDERTYYRNMQIIFSDQPYVKDWCWSLDGSAGCGLDYSLSRSATLCISYNYIYWQPVTYDSPWDFPLKSRNYREIFFTHKITAALLLDFKY